MLPLFLAVSEVEQAYLVYYISNTHKGATPFIFGENNMFHNFSKGFAPAAVIALSAALAGCDGVSVNIGENDGVPLSELDMSGPAPTELALIAPDQVIVTAGEELDITVEGSAEAVDAMRFTNEGGTLGIMRESGKWKGSGYAIVRVTMPAPEEIAVAGSGKVEADALASNAELGIAGSGKIVAANVEAEKLEVDIAGSGNVTANGSADRVEVSSAGSGFTDLSSVTAESADISIAGSGDVRLASDGKVNVSIAGSGDVTVTGSATCTSSTIGSGKVTCETVVEDS